MTRDEKGYIQFNYDWERAGPPVGSFVAELVEWRDRLFRLGLIGAYPDGIGYGNLSHRTTGSRFVISGTATGGLVTLGPEYFTEVITFNLERNWLRCWGPVAASSESLSHAAVYEAEPTAAAVIHVHHLGLWEQLRGRVPTTEPEAPAGTPAMARAIGELFRTTDVQHRGLFVMGGHREGLMTFGTSLQEAGERILQAFTGAGFAG